MKRTLSTFLTLILCIFPLLSLSAGKRTIWAYQGNVAYYEQNGLIGLLHKTGTRTIIAPIFNEVHPIIGDRANVRIDQLWGLIDGMGRWICRPLSVMPIYFGPEGDYGVFSAEPGHYGFIDRKGEVVLETTAYTYAGIMSGGLFTACDGERYGFVDVKGNVIIDFSFDLAYPFAEGLAAVQREGKLGYVNKAGEIVIPLEFEVAGSFCNGLAPVRRSGENTTVYIDQTGKVCLQGKWTWGGPFTKDKLALVLVDGKYGYINPKGHLTIPARYEEANAFGDGVASVKSGDSWVFIDKKGKIISKKYVEAGVYEGGFALVTYVDDGKGGSGEEVTGYINKGRFVVCRRVE